MELKPDGSNIAVTRDNVLEYIYLLVENRLLGIHKPCLEGNTYIQDSKSQKEVRS